VIDDSRACAKLRRYYDSFPWRALAVSRFVDDLLASGKLRPTVPAPRPRRLTDADEYEHPRTGEAMLGDLPHPGL
jgi:hypothetical protein